MYDLLTTRELTVLQNALFAAAEEAYWIVNAQDGDNTCFESYRLMHREIAHLFIEAGVELLIRLDCVKAA
jgi:hypothetical protein